MNTDLTSDDNESSRGESDKLARDVLLDKQYREVRIPAPDHVFNQLGVKRGNIFADCIKLKEKHPEQFFDYQSVKAHVEYVLQNPDYAIPASNKRFTLLVRKNKENKTCVVEFTLRGGKYRVRSAYVMSNEQLHKKLNIGNLK